MAKDAPAIAMGKPEKGKPVADSYGDAEELSVFGEYADDAFAAIKSGDKAWFKAALKAAIKSCYADDE